MNYEVTIGIPVYRAVDYIEKTMESALNQSFDSIEFLVVDDFGEDGSIAIVEKLQREHPRGKDIRILYNTQNEGVGVSRNRILDEASGRYLYFLDSDDLIKPDTIQLLVNAIQEHNADVAYGSLERIDRIGGNLAQSFVLPDCCFTSKDSLAQYAFKNHTSFQISVCNCLIDLIFLRRCQLRFIDAVFWEDLAFTYELVTNVNRAVFISNVTYHYLCRFGSLSHYQDRERLDKNEIQKNISVMDYLKLKCQALKDKDYLPYLCYNLEVNCFYIACYILKHSNRIDPKFKYEEIRMLLKYPLGGHTIFKYQHRLLSNLFFFLISKLPTRLFIVLVWLFGKVKKAI